MMQCMEDSFDVLEAAVMLHPRLINQNQFAALLADFATQLDLDNVWHRVAQNDRQVNNPFKHRTPTKAAAAAPAPSLSPSPSPSMSRTKSRQGPGKLPPL